MKVGEAWGSGDCYEPYVGRWSRLVAAKFLDWLAVGPGLRWLDVGCGTGALTAAILDHSEPSAVVAVDPSVGYIGWATAHVTDPRAHFRVADATHLPPGPFDVAVSGLVLNFVPDPGRALACMRAAAAGGLVAAYVWDYAGRMELIRQFWDAAVAMDPTAAFHDEGVRFPLCQPERLEELWHATGLAEVETRGIEVDTVLADFEDYWSSFLGGQGPAPGYAMSLNEERRAALRERIRARLPTEADGSIHLIARGWAVTGRPG